MESSHCRGPRNNYPARTVIRKSESGRVSLDSLRGVLNGDRGEGEGRILRDATLRLRQEKGPRLHSCGGEGEWSKPERVVGQARGSCLSVVGVHFRPPRGMQILTTCCHSHIYIYKYIYIFLFIFLIRALETGKSRNRNGTVLASASRP